MKKYPKHVFSSPEQLPKLAKRYDAVICGSDQVWNPNITNEDLSYFWDFCEKDTCRISYAPSSGVESLTKMFGDKVKEELKEFDFLSVREESGKDLVKQLSGLNAKLVVDPTFLMEAEQWQNYEKSQPIPQGGYILYYTVHSSQTLWEHCLSLAQKANMKILRIGSNVVSKQFKRKDSVEYVCDIGPAEWLYLVHNASYVVTNSFHGTAFSIIYRKNFFVEFSSATNSRLANIVNLLGLEKCVLQKNTDITVSATDYSKTEVVFPRMKAESFAFLEDALKCAENKGVSR